MLTMQKKTKKPKTQVWSEMTWDWWVLPYFPYEVWVKPKIPQDGIWHCELCNEVWESNLIAGDKKYHTQIQYKGFPKKWLTKKKCYKCKGRDIKIIFV